MQGDGGCVKTILALGSGYELPEHGDRVSVHYTGTLTDGSVFDSSRTRGEPFTFTLGKGEVIKGWDVGVASMRRGERAQLKLRSDYAYGESGSPPKIPANATLLFDVELLEWRSVRDVLGDGTVIKTVLKEGEGWQAPRPRDEVVYAIRAWNLASEADVLAAQGKDAALPSVGEAVYSSEMDVATGVPPAGLDASVADLEAARASLSLVNAGARNPLGPALGLALRGAKPGETLRVLAKRERTDAEDDALATLAELSVQAVRRVEDVIPTKLTRKTLREAEGWKKPAPGSVVRVKVDIKDAKGAVLFASTEGEPLSWTVDEFSAEEGAPGPVSEALDLIVQQMKQGETVEGQAYDAALVAPAEEGAYAAPEGSTAVALPVTLTVELLSFDAAKESWELSDEEKVAHAEATKARGTAAFKRGAIGRALTLWRRAEEAIKYDENFADAIKKQSRDLKKSLQLNLAAGSLKIGDAKGAAAAADAALLIDGENPKALYRRAQASMALGDYADAEVRIKRGIHGGFEPAVTRDFKLLLKTWKVKAAATNKKEAKVFGAMFKALGRDDGQKKNAAEAAESTEQAVEPPAADAADVGSFEKEIATAKAAEEGTAKDEAMAEAPQA